MDFSPEQCERAREQVAGLRNSNETYHSIAYNAQMQLNAAVDLLRDEFRGSANWERRVCAFLADFPVPVETK